MSILTNSVDTLKKDREQTTSVDKYPWLDPEDERRNMTDREILEKYINLGTSCLNKEEKLKLMDMLYKYKEAFSLRDEIGTCPNIEVEIEVMDKSPFLLDLYAWEGRRQSSYRQRNEETVLYGYPEGRIFGLLQPGNVDK